jgi:hypothetical protein
MPYSSGLLLFLLLILPLNVYHSNTLTQLRGLCLHTTQEMWGGGITHSKNFFLHAQETYLLLVGASSSVRTLTIDLIAFLRGRLLNDVNLS